MGAGLRPGQRVGDYVVEELLGEGGMAAVYRVRYPVLGTSLALKVLAPELRVNRKARDLFLQEAQVQARLAHPGIVRVVGVVATEDVAGLVMELVPGRSLGQIIADRRSLPRAEQIVALLTQICEAVEAAHNAGVIHRDLKPENVLITTDADGTSRIKVTDFGVAKVLAREGRTKESTAIDARMGTLPYMSPELVRQGAKVASVSSDVYAIGVIGYEFATGRAPFDSESDYDLMQLIVEGRCVPLSSERADLPPGLVAVIQRAMAVDANARTPSCSALLQELRQAWHQPAPWRNPTERLAPPAAQPSPARRALTPRLPKPHRSPAKRRAIVAGLAIGGSLAAALVTLVLLTASDPAADGDREASDDEAPATPPLTDASVQELIGQWLAAQNRNDVAAYGALYHEDIEGKRAVGKKGNEPWIRGRANWISDRRAGVEAIQSVAAHDVRIQLVEPTRAEVTLEQELVLREWADIGPKSLTIVSTAAGPKIAREVALESTVLGKRLADVTTARHVRLEWSTGYGAALTIFSDGRSGSVRLLDECAWLQCAAVQAKQSHLAAWQCSDAYSPTTCTFAVLRNDKRFVVIDVNVNGKDRRVGHVAVAKDAIIEIER